MSASDLTFQEKGARLLPRLPRGWDQGLAEYPAAASLLPLAEGLASFLPGPPGEPAILLFLLLLLAQAEGHTGLPLATGEGRLLTRLARAFGADPEALAALAASEALASLRGEPGGPLPLILEGGTLYAQRLHQAEHRLAQAIRARAQAPEGLGPEPDPAVLTQPDVLNAQQALAVQRALHGPLTLITGGPGTGKTSILVAILREALLRGTPLTRVALAAPTGKAANRMYGAIKDALARLPEDAGAPMDPAGLTPATLHRLLGYQPGSASFRHDEDHPLAADLVIVDESSMVDLLLMERLLRAVRPEARLVLLGDAQQLPSVEAGCVFQDLVATLPEAVVHLVKSYRMDHAEGQPVLHAALKLSGALEGDLFQAPHPVLPHLPGNLDPRVAYLDGGTAEVKRFLLDWFHTRIEHAEDPTAFLQPIQHVHVETQGEWRPEDALRLKHLFDLQRQTRILCPIREGTGVRCAMGINAFLHKSASLARDRGLSRTLAVSLGEPVMMTRNDYRRWLFNGDQGLVLKVARDGGPARLEAVFPSPDGGFKAHAMLPILPHLELGYALTVHKSQGSEYDEVIIVLPGEASPFVTKEILYTALTRAKRVVTIVGSEEAIRSAMGRTQARHTGLKARITA